MIALPHLVQDDGRLLAAYIRSAKRVADPSEWLWVCVDQSFHLVALLGAALLAAA